MNRTVFIGSSTEALALAEELAVWLEECNITPIMWNTIFTPGTLQLQSLLNISSQVSGAIFVFNADDKLWYRGNRTTTVRDNVLFEYGLFAGKTTMEQVIFACNGKPKIPSDLFGMTYLNLSSDKKFTSKKIFQQWAKSLPETSIKISKTNGKKISESIEAQQYDIVYEELGFIYKDLFNATFVNSVSLTSLANYFRYYTERYAWSYGGELIVSPCNTDDLLVDQYRDNEYTAYTLRLCNPLERNSDASTGFIMDILNSTSLHYMFLGSSAAFCHSGPLKLWVKIPNSMKFVQAKLKKYANPADTIATEEEKIDVKGHNYIERTIPGPRENGLYYSLEWNVEMI